MEGQEVTLEEIERAASVLKGVIRVTPLDRSRTLSEETGIDLYLKMENFQRAGSFKMRGAYYKIHSLSDSERKRGVVAASAGNHAQGVAHAATISGGQVDDRDARERLARQDRRDEGVRGEGGPSRGELRGRARDGAGDSAEGGRDASSTPSTTRWSSRGRGRRGSR